MNYVVYLDVFLIINTFMDFLILIIAKSLIKPQTTIFKCFIGAMVGGGMSVVSLLIPYKFLWIRFITSYVFICLVMCRIAFKTKGLRNNIKNMCLVYAVTFCLGGAMNAVYYYTSFGFVISRILSGEYINTVNIIRFISIAFITYIVTDFLIQKINQKKCDDKRIYDVIICCNGRNVCIKALLDTGNLLFDPISGRKVHIIEYEAVKDIVDKEKGFYRVIPFNSVGKSRGLLDAVEVDGLEIMTQDKDEPSVKLNKQIIALYDKKLASDNRFEGLLHSSVSELL